MVNREPHCFRHPVPFFREMKSNAVIQTGSPDPGRLPRQFTRLLNRQQAAACSTKGTSATWPGRTPPLMMQTARCCGLLTTATPPSSPMWLPATPFIFPGKLRFRQNCFFNWKIVTLGAPTPDSGVTRCRIDLQGVPPEKDGVLGPSPQYGQAFPEPRPFESITGFLRGFRCYFKHRLES